MQLQLKTFLRQFDERPIKNEAGGKSEKSKNMLQRKLTGVIMLNFTRLANKTTKYSQYALDKKNVDGLI